MTTEWFRNTTWNESVERDFEQKLRGARRKEQYLRIQASTLARSHPEVALKLLDRYFELPDDFDHAQAYVDRAAALLALGRVDDAIVSYEAALTREAAFPAVQTQAYVDLPYLIATRGVREQYNRARQLLEVHEARLMFPVDHFRWHAARALLAADIPQPGVATIHARRALDAAASEDSGFRHHPSVGLVTEQYDDLIRKLEAYRAAQQLVAAGGAARRRSTGPLDLSGWILGLEGSNGSEWVAFSQKRFFRWSVLFWRSRCAPWATGSCAIA